MEKQNELEPHTIDTTQPTGLTEEELSEVLGGKTDQARGMSYQLYVKGDGPTCEKIQALPGSPGTTCRDCISYVASEAVAQAGMQFAPCALGGSDTLLPFNPNR